MKLKSLLAVGILFLSTTLMAGTKTSQRSHDVPDSDINQVLLPSPFPVYVDGTTVVNHPVTGFKKKNLPTNNDYKGNPGCYIACYSHKKKHAIYAAGQDIYVMGQIRVPGKYEGRTCIPKHFKEKDIGGEKQLKRLCKKKIKSCGKRCWAGGDTGGWFGVQP